MEINDIFATLKARMLSGMVFHDEMARYFDFLGLSRYRDMHREHYQEETDGYTRLCEYYMHHFNKLIPTQPMERPDVIPDGWYMYTRQEVDTGTKRNAVKSAMQKWVDWESETKDLLENMCGELLNNGEIATEKFISQFVTDVDYELAEAKQLHIKLESIGYDITLMV